MKSRRGLILFLDESFFHTGIYLIKIIHRETCHVVFTCRRRYARFCRNSVYAYLHRGSSHVLDKEGEKAGEDYCSRRILLEKLTRPRSHFSSCGNSRRREHYGSYIRAHLRRSGSGFLDVGGLGYRYYNKIRRSLSVGTVQTA